MRAGEGVTDRLVRPFLPQTVREGGALHFDDLGTQVAEQPAQFPARNDDAQIEHTDSRQWPAPHCGIRFRVESLCPPEGFIGVKLRRRSANTGSRTIDSPVAHGDGSLDAGSDLDVGQCPGRIELIGMQGFRRRQDGRDWH